MTVFIAGSKVTDAQMSVAREHGMGVELQEFATPDTLDRAHERDLDALRQRLSEHAGRALHGPFSELFPGSRDAEVRKTALRRFQTSYELAERLGAEHLILHYNFIPETMGDPGNWLERSAELWTRFLSGKDDSLEIHIENTYEHDHHQIMGLIDQIDKPFFSVCLDVGHCNAFSRQSMRSWTDGLGERIGYVHLHNNHGSSDEHLGLTKGSLNMGEALDLLRRCAPKATWTIEAQPEDIPSSVAWLRDRGYCSYL